MIVNNPKEKPAGYKRVLLKLSGESLMGDDAYGINQETMGRMVAEISDIASSGVEVAVVIGGGNIFRGVALGAAGMDRATADYMGMLGTVMNAVALKEKLDSIGIDSRVMSALDIRAVAEPFIRGRAIRHLEKGRVVILAAGTGNPFFTTDTCASLRATELDCEILLKATKVDGVYTADPHKDPSATRYESLTFNEALEKRLGVMDMTALTMCQERNIPLLVFDFKIPGNIRKVIDGEPIGTLLTNAELIQN